MAPLPSPPPAHPSEIHPGWWWCNEADVLLSFYFYVFRFFFFYLDQNHLKPEVSFLRGGNKKKKETYCNKKKGKIMLNLLCVAGKDDQLPDI